MAIVIKEETMVRVVLIFGFLAGAIVSALMLISFPLIKNGIIDFDNGETVGYASMIIALSMVFFGIKSYRDNYQKGIISFGKGFQVGILITLIAALMYAVSWEIYYQNQPADEVSFMDRYIEHSINKMKEDGASEAEIKQMADDMKEMGEAYKNPVIRFGFTLMEILPVGLLLTLLSSLLLRNKNFLPTT